MEALQAMWLRHRSERMNTFYVSGVPDVFASLSARHQQEREDMLSRPGMEGAREMFRSHQEEQDNFVMATMDDTDRLNEATSRLQTLSAQHQQERGSVVRYMLERRGISNPAAIGEWYSHLPEAGLSEEEAMPQDPQEESSSGLPRRR
jgi:hypothetical protein